MAQHPMHMPVTRVVLPDPLKTIIGPRPACSAKLWARLTGFDDWPQWWPGVHTVRRIDQGETGRGSAVLLNEGLAEWHCSITHWHPLNRLDLDIASGSRHRGYSFVLDDADEPDAVELQLRMEFQFGGLARWAKGVLLWVEKRRARRLLDRLRLSMEGERE